MLTTYDNPYSPFDQFDLWQLYDIEMGYNTCQLLGRIIKLESDMTEKEREEAYDLAVDEIIKYDDLGIYVRANENSTFPVGK
jgi:hypothetical protein